MHFAHKIFERPNVSLHYWIGGDSERPLVVLTHGGTVDHHEWDVTAAIVGEKYRTLLWDIRSHGKSRPAKFFVDDSVNDLLALLDEVGASQATLVGHSLGGNLHQELVFRQPHRVHAMVCVDSTGNFQRLSWMESLLVKAAGPTFRMYPHPLLVNHALSAASNTTAGRDLLRSAMMNLTREEFVQISMEMTRYLHHEPGYLINKPLLLILGEKDAAGNIRKTMPMWANVEPNCKLVVIPGVTHSPHLDAPDLFHQELMQFLEKHVS